MGKHQGCGKEKMRVDPAGANMGEEGEVGIKGVRQI